MEYALLTTCIRMAWRTRLAGIHGYSSAHWRSTIRRLDLTLQSQLRDSRLAHGASHDSRDLLLHHLQHGFRTQIAAARRELHATALLRVPCRLRDTLGHGYVTSHFCHTCNPTSPIVYNHAHKSDTGPRSDAHETFTDFEDLAGWGNVGLACLVGISSPVITLVGADSSCHLSEELKNAAWVLPRAMVATALTNYVLGMSINILIFLSHSHTNTV